MKTTPRLLIVDDHLLFRESLKSVITDQNIGCVIGEASNGLEFIDLLSQLKPDLVIMDIDMPDMNGIEATEKALKVIPNLKFIAYTMYDEEDYYNRMIALGVKGFILKSCGIAMLENAIHEVMKGNTYFDPMLREKIGIRFENSIANNTKEDILQNDHPK